MLATSAFHVKIGMRNIVIPGRAGRRSSKRC